MKKIIVLAVILRLLLSVFLFHPDIKTFNYLTSFLKKGVVNIYPYLSENKQKLSLKEDFVYFPPVYFTVGGYQAFISTFLGDGLDTWLADANSVSIVINDKVFTYLLFLKLPLLLTDLAIGFVLMKFFDKKENQRKAFIYWLFNPFTPILIYAFSNIDLYAVLATLLAFLAVKKKRLFIASVFLGLAACFKLYPLLFVPFLFLKGKNSKEKVFLAFIPILILLLSIAPFLSGVFVSSALVSGLTTRIFNPAFSIGFGESMIMGFFLLSALFSYTWVNNKKFVLMNYWIIVLFITFSFSHFHISWLLWIAPFLVILIIKNKTLLWPIVIWSCLAITIPFLYEDRSMTISLFRLYSTWFDLLPTPFSVMEKFYDPYNFQSLLHSLMAGVSVVISYKVLKDGGAK